MRETGKAPLRPTLLPNQFKRKQQSKKFIHSKSSNFLPDEHSLKPSFPFALPTQQKSMPQQIKKCNNTIVLPSEDRRIIRTSNKSLQMIQYEKIDTTLNDSQEMKKQIEKYLFDRFLHWVQHLNEGQIREVYDEIVRERRFLQAKQMKYEWMQRQRKIKKQQQNLAKKQAFKQRCEREQRQRISNKCRQILSCQPPSQARKSLAPIEQPQLPLLKIKSPAQAISLQQSLSEVEQQSHKILDFQISIPSYVDEDQNKNPSLLQNTNNCRQENQYSPIQSLISTVDAIREIGGKKKSGNQDCKKYLRVSRAMEQLREMEEIKEMEDIRGMGMPSKRLRWEGNEEAKIVESQRKLKENDGLKQGNGAKVRTNRLKESEKVKSQQIQTEKYQIRNFVVLIQKFEIGNFTHPHDSVQF